MPEQNDGYPIWYPTTEELPEVRSLKFDQVLGYLEMRKAGESHRMAIMLATRSFPGVKTDSVFNEGKFSGDAGRVGPEQLWLREQAESAGVSTNGKWYCHGLASYPGDPTAWIDGRGDVERIAREKNMTVHGYVEQKGRQVEPSPDIPVDPTLIEAETLDILDEYPGSKYEEVYEHVHDVRTGKIDGNPLLVSE